MFNPGLECNMHDALWIALIVGLPPAIISLATLLGAITQLIRLRQVEKRLDGRLTQLLDTTAAKEHAEGKLDEREERRERDRQGPLP